MSAEWSLTASNASGWGVFLMWQPIDEGHTLTITVDNEIVEEEESGWWELLFPHPSKDELLYKCRSDIGLMNWEWAW